MDASNSVHRNSLVAESSALLHMLLTPAKLISVFIALGVYVSPPVVPEDYRPIAEPLSEVVEIVLEDFETRKKRVANNLPPSDRS